MNRRQALLLLLALAAGAVTAVVTAATETKHTIRWQVDGKRFDQALYLGEPELLRRHPKETGPARAGDQVELPYRLEKVEKRGLPEWIYIQPVRVVPADDKVAKRRGKPKEGWIVGNRSGYRLSHYRHYTADLIGGMRMQLSASMWPPRQPNEDLPTSHWRSSPDALVVTWEGMTGDAIYVDLRQRVEFQPGVLSSASGGTLTEVE